jgi:cytochrome P450
MHSETKAFLQDPYLFCKKNGRNPFKARVFGINTLFVSDPIRARLALTLPDSILSGRAGNRDVANKLFGTSVLYADGKWHRLLRDAMKGIFAPMTESSEASSSSLAFRVAEKFSGRSRVSSHKFFRILSISITAAHFLGIDLSLNEAKKLSQLIDFIGKGLYASAISTKKNSRFGKAALARVELDTFLKSRIGEKFSIPLREAGLDQNCILDQAVTILFAGVDTSSVVLTFATEYLCEKIDAGSTLNRSLINAAIRFALLRYPPVYFIPRGALADIELDGVFVRKGGYVNVMICALHEDIVEGEKSPGYMPFGLGGKRCPGEAFAIRSSAVVLERLFTSFKVILTGERNGLEFMPGLRPAVSSKMTLSLVTQPWGDHKRA